MAVAVTAAVAAAVTVAVAVRRALGSQRAACWVRGSGRGGRQAALGTRSCPSVRKTHSRAATLGVAAQGPFRLAALAPSRAGQRPGHPAPAGLAPVHQIAERALWTGFKCLHVPPGGWLESN